MVTRRERADILALVCDVYCDLVAFPFGILGQVWYLIASVPDPCRLSYFEWAKQLLHVPSYTRDADMQILGTDISNLYFVFE